jgi:GNAT superfamily N-acetyltransferase
MEDAFQVKTFELSEKNALLSFLSSAYPDTPRHSDPRFWVWHFLESPHVSPDALPIWIIKHGEQIVGQLAAIPVELKVDGKQTRAIWILDLIVLHEYRRRGLAKRLVRAAEEFCPIRLGVNTHEQFSPQLLKSLGWMIVTNIPRYSKLLFPGTAIREVSQFRPLQRLVNMSYAPFRPRLSKQPQNVNGKLSNVGQFDVSFDELWQDASVQWPCAVVRDARILKWQYCEQPGKRFDVLGYYEGDKLLGYVVLFFRKTDAQGNLSKAAITDLLYHPEKPVETVNALLRGSLELACRLQAGTLVTDVIDPLIQERLHYFGFWRVKNPLLLMVKSQEHQDLLYNPANWFLTRGDSDISIFEQPNL